MLLRFLPMSVRVFVLGSAACAGLVLCGCPVKAPGGNNNGNNNGNQNDNGTITPIRVDVTVGGRGQVVQDVVGTDVTLTATPAAGWRFDHWSGAVEGTDNPITVPAVTAGTAVTAMFVEEAPPDADADGVADAADDCAATPAGATVDANGCAASQLDADGDGISDDHDLCPNTPAGGAVNASGCEMTPQDFDGDGVMGDVDLCPNTPPGTPVDATGCSIVVGPTDTDHDGINDNLDQCPATPAGDTVDENGCTVPDADNDNVPDGNDTCPNTPPGQQVNSSGCSDTDGDGVADSADLCPGTRATAIVDANGCIPGTPPPPPPPPPPVDEVENNSCSAPITVNDGVTAFTSLTATTDGPQDTGVCSIINFQSDVWYCYTATCDELVTVSLCLSSFDATVAVYRGCGCPTTNAITCDDDFCAASGPPRVRFAADPGESYMIRVGGYNGTTGNGALDIACAPAPDVPAICQGATGDCIEGQPGVGCGDATCCETICEIDSYCCEIQWDDLCAEEANEACTGKFSVCNSSEEACDLAHSSPGCSADGCCLQVCQENAYCCLVEWDEICVDLADNCQN